MQTTMDGYVRVSRVGGRSGDSFISPQVQRESIQRYAYAHEIDIAAWHEDLDQSGGKMSRPAFDQMLARVEVGESGGVIVARLDRFGRSLVGSLAAIQRIDDAGGKFVSVSDSFDTSTPNGRLILRIMLSLGEFELERIRDSWAVAGSSAVGRGIHITPTVPYGYRKNGDKRLVPDDAAEFVAQAFQNRAAGWTWQRIADWLNEAAPAREEGRPWTAKTVERMIRRRTYLGVAHWGEHENPDAHQPLVDEALWNVAQRRVQTYSKARQGDVALLHSIVRCAGCRFQMSRALNTSQGRQRHYYRCRVHRVSGVCEAPAAVRADGDDGLEAYIESVVCAELDRRAETYTSVDDSDSLAEAIANLDIAEEELDAYLSNTDLISIVGAQRFNEGAKQRQAVVEAGKSRLDALRGPQAGDTAGFTSEAYSALEREDRAEVLRAMVDVIFVRNTKGPRGPQAIPLDSRRVRILWRGEAPDLPSSNKASAVIPWPWPSEDDAPARAGEFAAKDG
jgi:site-specific DNA recombinase